VTEADVIGAVLVGFAAGVSSGLLGVGGGVLFVPGLVFFLSLSQLSAEATSLVAIVPVAIVGALRQRGYDNLRVRDGLAVGLLSLPGVAGGALLADSLPERPLELAFATVQIVFAVGLARRALQSDDSAV
jgi:uncharacterized membrane protein YfcA